MTFEIRKACPADARGIAEVVRESFPRSVGERVERHLHACLAMDSDHTVLVAVDAEEAIAGYASVHWLPYLFLEGPEGFVSELFVRESARGRGAGRALLDSVRREALSRGCARLSLLNMRRRPSYERGFYRKAGWQERPLAANFVLHLSPVPESGGPA